MWLRRAYLVSVQTRITLETTAKWRKGVKKPLCLKLNWTITWWKHSTYWLRVKSQLLRHWSIKVLTGYGKGKFLQSKKEAQKFRRFATVGQNEERFRSRSKVFHWTEALTPGGCLWLLQNEECLWGQSRYHRSKLSANKEKACWENSATALLMKLVSNMVI